MADKTDFLANNRTHQQIRQSGAIGNLNEGIEIILHGIPTRLIAWPGNGYQTESVHVLTLKPGLESQLYTYQIAEEALLCIQGQGEVFLRGKWLTIEPGDMAYFPEKTPHAVRNSAQNQDDCIFVSAITPPLVSLYEEAGFYIEKLGMMDYSAIEEAQKHIKPGNIIKKNFTRYHETHPEYRAWNLTSKDIRQHGALFNIYRGAEFHANGSPMRFVLWPGHGARQCGYHLTRCAPGDMFAAHIHPISDECVVVWAGHARGFLDGQWIEMDIHDCILAPCGVPHGGPLNIDTHTIDDVHQSSDTLWGGFASPPQGDLYLRAGYIKDGEVSDPPAVRFTNIEIIE